jgi:hypothetical protein
MDFSVEFYETTAGKCPVREFLDELQVSDPEDFAAVTASNHEPLSKALATDSLSNGMSASSKPACSGSSWKAGGSVCCTVSATRGKNLWARPRHRAGAHARLAQKEPKDEKKQFRPLS